MGRRRERRINTGETIYRKKEREMYAKKAMVNLHIYCRHIYVRNLRIEINMCGTAAQVLM
jgi:hypothetical protein